MSPCHLPQAPTTTVAPSANSGVVTNALSFPAKAANTWGTTTINVTLPAGTSTLKLDFLPNVSTGNLALDSLTLQKA